MARKNNCNITAGDKIRNHLRETGNDSIDSIREKADKIDWFSFSPFIDAGGCYSLY